MENSKRPSSAIDQVADQEASLDLNSQDLNSQDPNSQNERVLTGSPPSIANARPDLNASVTHDQRVPDMNEGGDDLVATGTGTLGGAAVGATLGMVGGPPGAVVGGIIGGVMGGIAGNDIAKTHATDDQDRYWRERYQHTPYYQESQKTYPDIDYERDYQTAYRLGYEDRANRDAKVDFTEAEPDLRSNWEKVKGESRLQWEQAKFAVKDAWERVTH